MSLIKEGISSVLVYSRGAVALYSALGYYEILPCLSVLCDTICIFHVLL